jgi:hypothetical protein
MRRNHSESNQKKVAEKKPKKEVKNLAPEKKFGIFYKISLFLLLLVLIVLSYFIILVSTEPKSIPYVTEKIESSLQKKFGSDVALSSSYISFTRYGTLKVTVSSLKILYALPNIDKKQAFIIPILETEFSLFNFLLLRFQPSKIKIINSEIILDDLEKLHDQLQEIDSSSNKQMPAVIKFLTAIRKGEIPIKNLEIENAKLLIRTQDNSAINQKIIIKNSRINSSVKNKNLNIASESKISLGENMQDIDFTSNCQLAKNGGLKCDLFLENFTVSSIAKIYPNLNLLDKINANVTASASFFVKDDELQNLTFDAKANRGSFEFLEFFSQKMSFNDFSIKGEYDEKLGILNLSDIEGDFVSEIFLEQTQPLKSHFAMSLLISDLKNPDSKKLDFYIKLQNVSNDEMEKFWPSYLSDAGIREWVTERITGGMIKNAYAKFSLIKTPAGNQLSDMNSEIVFSGFNLNYDENFPPITNVSGIANFTKNGMKISITDGKVLRSRVYDAVVAIDDFEAPINMLKISGRTQGKASDALKHVDYKSEFAGEIEKYLNGNSSSDFDIRIPLKENLALKDVYISVNSAVAGLNNEYAKGGVVIHSKKDFRSTNFVTNVDLTAAELVYGAFDITKKTNVESGLDLVVVVKDPTKIRLKNILLWKKEEKKDVKKMVKDVPEKNPQEKVFEVKKIYGDIEFATAPFLLKSAAFKNDNFGENDYAISYRYDEEKAVQRIAFKAKKFNFASLLENKFFQKMDSANPVSSLQLQVSAENTAMLNNKALRNVSLSLGCKNGFCHSLGISANYGRKQGLSLRSIKKPKEKNVGIEGYITDVGYMAEALGISKTISGGNAKVELQTSMMKKQLIEGVVKIENNITFYESLAVKRLAKNDLFSKVKDKIFSSEKTTFDFVKLEFDLQGSNLNIKSLIANNYKIGITAKGMMNLKNDTYEIRGMIVPGFIINNLFGIGNIPILRNILTGGEGGGLFGIRYSYIKKRGDKEATFETNKVSSFVPSTIQNLFD